MKCEFCGQDRCLSLECDYEYILKYSFKGNKKNFEKWLWDGEPRDEEGLPIVK